MTFAANLAAFARRGITGVGNLLSFDANGRYPVGDGSQLTGLLKGGTTVTLSGTAVDFTGIPSTAKRIVVVLDGVSITGTPTTINLQLGKAAGMETSGYQSSCGIASSGSASGATSTIGMQISWAGGAPVVGWTVATLVKTGNNRWACAACGGLDNGGGVNYSFSGGGGKTLADTLDRLRITTSTGTDTFDAGTATVYWE